ncbi:cilia- and flagella-associated protein 45-like [Labrus mixtus]|uniref:cilia- and flagella-associated protein 45-like n=1 Tax=Labrus mixtus TaxID=508554 RepID=UPI0029C051AD|nr:cilia- and flagella-associated protein 45-like [Labrus mixtus]
MRRGYSHTSTTGSSNVRRYRTRAPTSQVDESPFGSPKPLDKHGNSAYRIVSQPRKIQETVQILGKDQIRNIRIPSKDPLQNSLILSSSEMQRLLTASLVVTKKETYAKNEAYQKDEEEKIKAAKNMKHQMMEIDRLRKQNMPLTQEEIDSRDRAQKVCGRSITLRMEQDEDIKKVNKMILQTQCQAIREAQIHEKKRIQAEMAEEEKRLDSIMESERRKAVENIEKIHDLHKQKMKMGKQQIYNQILQHEQEKQLQHAKKEQEKQLTRERHEKLKLEELRAKQKKREDQQLLQKEITRINAETMQAKSKMLEEEMLSDRRRKEYTQKKLIQEAECDAAQRRIKKERELEIGKMLAQQNKLKDIKAKQDEIRSQRIQEMEDRKWRRKEKDLAMKKAQENAMLRAYRLEQDRYKEQQMLVKSERKKAEFDRMMDIQNYTMVKQREEEEKRRQKAQQLKEALQEQIKERELLAKDKRRETLQETEKFTEEGRHIEVLRDMITEKKLKELKASGVPEKYCTDLEKRVYNWKRK